MKTAQIARLKALLAKGETLTGDEAKELLKLKTLAAKSKFDPETGEAIVGDANKDNKDEPDEGLSEEAVKTLVAESTAKAFEGIGLDKETVKALKDRLEQNTVSTPEEIQKAIKDVLGGENVDMKALAEAIKKGLPASALTEEKVKGLLTQMFDEFKTSQRKESKMAFPSGEANFPIEHRSGNMTVAAKQLLNICMMHVGEEGLAKSDGGRGIKRPTSMNDGITDEQIKAAVRSGDMFAKQVRQECVYGRKTAITAGGTGTGAEFVNTDLSSDLQARMYMESQLASFLVASEITMPSNPFKLPLSTSRPTFYKGSEGGTPTVSNPGTAAITLDAQKLIGYCEYSYEADEDAIIAILPWMQEMLAKAAAEALEDAFINGDTTGSHMDSDVTGATDARKLFKGLRYYAKAVAALKVSFATGGITSANIGALRKAMGKYGMKPADMFLLCGTSGYNDIVLLAETLTAEKAGAAARILTGNAPQIFGIPIIPSSKMREDLNASGVYDGSTVTKGSLLLVHRPAWYVGVKRGLMIEVDTNKLTQVNQVIASFRRDFKPRETPSATEQTVVLGYNFTA